jgi:general secretion pathway protein K
LATLWLAAALTAIALSVAATVRSETERAASSTDGMRAQLLANGSVERGILWVNWGRTTSAVNPDGSPRFYRPPMSFFRYQYASGEAVVELIPESGKLNVNVCPPEDLVRLLLMVGATEPQALEITAAIVDWRTPAAELTPFDQFYLMAQPSFRSRHSSLEEIEEILLVKGMTPELFYGKFERTIEGRLVPRGGLRDSLTAYGQGTGFDLNSAAPELMLLAGLTPEAAARIVTRRAVRPFQNVDEARQLVGPFPGLSRFTVGGNEIWTLRATAWLKTAEGKRSELSRSASATVRFLPPDQFNPAYHVLRWREDAWSPVGIAQQMAAQPAAPLTPDAGEVP